MGIKYLLLKSCGEEYLGSYMQSICKAETACCIASAQLMQAIIFIMIIHLRLQC